MASTTPTPTGFTVVKHLPHVEVRYDSVGWAKMTPGTGGAVGVVVGLVYLDDVLEEIVGNDIQDEFETDTARDFLSLGNGQYVANGAIALFDLEEELTELGEIDCDGSVSTRGGYIT